MRLLAKLALLVIALSTPITLAAIVRGYSLMFHEDGMIVFVIACFSTVVSAVGVASLFDSQERTQNRR